MNRTLAQNLALGFGVVFLVVGILGFIPGITTNYDDLEFAGTDSAAELLGIFQVSILHNIAHLLFGVGILAARTHELARTYLLGGASTPSSSSTGSSSAAATMPTSSR